jgi:4'-phosphopantetheinyl transferase
MPEHLAALDVHVWSVHLDAPMTHAAPLTACLSAEERSRLESCVTDVARRRFALGRATLRQVLSLYTGTAPADVRLYRGEYGKPLLESAEGPLFSMTHSGEAALIAVARVDVGIDMEHDRVPHLRDRIARRIFHPDTAALLAELHPERRKDAFLDAWTLREAHVKAVGGGLFRTPDALPFHLDHPPDQQPRTVFERNGRVLWSVVRLCPGEGLRAAIVARGKIQHVHVRSADYLLNDNPYINAASPTHDRS